jgi:hypothetical protein
MTILGGTTSYWDMYFILKLLPNEKEPINVDIYPNTREHAIIDVMKFYGHIYTNADSDTITMIAATKRGIKFYNYLVMIGYGTTVSEEEGKQKIKLLELEFNKK